MSIIRLRLNFTTVPFSYFALQRKTLKSNSGQKKRELFLPFLIQNHNQVVSSEGHYALPGENGFLHGKTFQGQVQAGKENRNLEKVRDSFCTKKISGKCNSLFCSASIFIENNLLTMDLFSRTKITFVLSEEKSEKGAVIVKILFRCPRRKLNRKMKELVTCKTI